MRKAELEVGMSVEWRYGSGEREQWFPAKVLTVGPKDILVVVQMPSGAEKHMRAGIRDLRRCSVGT